MDNAFKMIVSDLNTKYELMNKLYEQIKKVVKKKDYLKDFGQMNPQKLNVYELDTQLDIYLQTIIDLIDDHKELQNDSYRVSLLNIKELNEKITANKKYFNKQNNLLIKNLKGFTKFVAKIKHISIQNSFETKKPIE